MSGILAVCCAGWSCTIDSDDEDSAATYAEALALCEELAAEVDRCLDEGVGPAPIGGQYLRCDPPTYTPETYECFLNVYRGRICQGDNESWLESVGDSVEWCERDAVPL